MSLLFFDGFDHYNTAAMSAKWTAAGGTINAGTGRNSTQSLRDPNQPFLYLPGLTDTTFIAGGWYKFRTAFTANNIIMEVSKGGNADGSRQVWLRTNADGTLSVMTGAGALATSTFALSLATEYFIEFKVLIDDTVGTAVVRVTNVSSGAVANVINLTGADTKNTANTGWDCFRITSAGLYDLDDLYICDGSGTVHNDFLGDCRVETIYPVTDAVAAGANAGLTPSTGTDHGALVDENPSNGDTDYNSSATVGVKDTYNLGAMSSSGAIQGVQVNLSTKKTDLVTKTLCPVLRTLAVDYDGTTVDAYTTYEYTAHELFETNPSTGLAWTAAQVNALECGMKVVA